MPDITSFPEVTKDERGFRIRLPRLAVIGARYQELRHRDDYSWVQPGSAESWLDFCRQLVQIMNKTTTWREWDENAPSLDRAHPSKFTELTRRIEAQRPLPSDPAAERERLRAVMKFREQKGTLARVEDIWRLIEQEQQTGPSSDDSEGLQDYLRRSFEWAKSAGYARGMPLDEFEPEFQQTISKPPNVAGVFRLDCGGDQQSVTSLCWLLKNQNVVVELLQPALVRTFIAMREQEPMEKIWFPDGDAASLALDRFRIKSISVQQDHIIFSFQVPCAHFCDGGCYAVIQNEKLEMFGTGDELFEEYQTF